MSFFSLAIEPGKGYTLDVEEAFRVTTACLGAFEGGVRSVLKVAVDEEEVVLCSLTPQKQENQTLDLMFSEGESVTFKVEGKNAIHISGNYLSDPMMDYDSEEDEEIYSDDVVSEVDEDGDAKIVEVGSDEDVAEVAEKEESEDEQEVSDEEEEEEEVSEEEVLVGNNKRSSPAKEEKVETKKVRFDKDEKKKEVSKKQEQPKKEQPKPQEKQQEKKPEEESKKKTLPSGLVMEDTKRGDGARAKNGKRVSVRYIGKLTNGKVFDSNTKGKPFSFVLGKGEVIKGWDLGVQGMQVGGMRRLTVPPALAYGSQGAPPDIPKNATLIFEVKLLGVN